MTKITPLRRGCYYHIYNRGNNREDLFVEKRNYRYFFDLYINHIEPVAETFAYCLLRNHFHLLVRIKDDLPPPEPSRRFGNLFNAYARSFNLAYHRTGTLFQRPFSRVEVTNEHYFATLVIYIHRNPQKHAFVTDFRDWPYSSYHTLVNQQPTRLQRDVVLNWFGNATHFIAAHTHDVIIEDDQED